MVLNTELIYLHFIDQNTKITMDFLIKVNLILYSSRGNLTTESNIAIPTTMALPVMEFSRQGYKIEKVFA